MLFRRNKINKSIQNASASTTSSDFSSLSDVKKQKKKNSVVTKLFVNQYHYAKENFQQKKQLTKTFFKNNWFNLFNIFFVCLLLVTFIIGCVIAFLPFFSGNPTDPTLWSVISNFYTAKFSNGGYVFGLTSMGIAFVVLFVISILCAVFYFTYSLKKRCLLFEKTKITKIISIIAYVCILVAFFLLFVAIVIPPSLSGNNINGQEINTLKTLIANTSVESEKISYIKELYALLDLAIPSGNIIDKYNDDLTNGVFNIPTQNIDNYSLFHIVFLYKVSQLSAGGIVMVCFISIFAITGAIILPIVLFILTINFDIKMNTGVKEEWSTFRAWTYSVISSTSTKTRNWFFGKIKEINEKPSYRKYKKQIKEDGTSFSKREQLFDTEQTNNARLNVITKQEIESHEPNKAFLNNQGQWMYHDGKGKYYIVKNDQWVPFDINEAIHEAQVNVNFVSNNNTKVAKERKLFKNNKFLNKMEEKKKYNNNTVSVDLPDEDLNRIISELDI